MAHNKFNRDEDTVKLFTDMMISRIKEMKASNWKMGWMAGKTKTFGLPQNISGRNYAGLNSLFLLWETASKKYSLPLYLTFMQADKEGLRINQGSKSFPVLYWEVRIKDKDGKKISKADFHNLSDKEKEECEVKTILRTFNVFNIDQTNVQKVKPELYNKLKERFEPSVCMDVRGMYENKAIDRIINTQGWVCPIKPSESVDGPVYSVTGDYVVIPEKYRFKVSKKPEEIYKDGMEYYSSLLHEMAHSTGAKGRENRFPAKGEATKDSYAKEELVAELSSALVGNTMGFDKRILNNNAAYLDGWLKNLQEDPTYLVSVMSAVSNASKMIMESIDVQKMVLGERPLLYENQQKALTKNSNLAEGMTDKPEQAAIMHDVKASVFKTPEGEYAVQATVNGKALDPLTIDRETGAKYMYQPPSEKKNAALAQIVRSSYGNRLQMNLKSDEHHSQSLKL